MRYDEFKGAEAMATLRPYSPQDAETILSWIKDETSYYQWCAGLFGPYHPLTEEEFTRKVTAHIPYTYAETDRPVGFLFLRVPEGRDSIMRLGFVILDPQLRGKGLGSAMVREALNLVFHHHGMKRAELGVFDNNPSALYCYEAAGFQLTGKKEEYPVGDSIWICLEMEKINDQA